MKGAKISITIPVHHNPCVDELIKFIVNFPLRIPRTLKRLMHWRRHSRTLGSSHKNRITIHEISKFFHVTINAKSHPNYYPIRALQKLRIIKETVRAWTPAENYYIFAEKTELREC
jgi:hypothetical protein